MLFRSIKEEHNRNFEIKMSTATGYQSDEDDQPKTFEVIEVFKKGEDRFELEPLGLLYRDPRADKNGGFVEELGYIVDFNSTRRGDKIKLLINTATEAREAVITRIDPNNYVADPHHDVYCKRVDISCSKNPPPGRTRNTRRRRRGGGGSSANHA